MRLVSIFSSNSARKSISLFHKMSNYFFHKFQGVFDWQMFQPITVSHGSSSHCCSSQVLSSLIKSLFLTLVTENDGSEQKTNNPEFDKNIPSENLRPCFSTVSVGVDLWRLLSACKASFKQQCRWPRAEETASHNKCWIFRKRSSNNRKTNKVSEEFYSQ